LSYFEDALEKDENSVKFLMNRSQCYFELGNRGNSISDLEKALEVGDVDNPLVLYKLGLAYFSNNKFKRSI
jgi:tetratricopeptide (TPR) repeat protein